MNLKSAVGIPTQPLENNTCCTLLNAHLGHSPAIGCALCQKRLHEQTGLQHARRMNSIISLVLLEVVFDYAHLAELCSLVPSVQLCLFAATQPGNNHRVAAQLFSIVYH